MKSIKIVGFCFLISISSLSLSYASFDINLGMGARNDNVKKIQQFLGVEPTGYFGNGTLKAVKDFQKKNNLPNTGYWGNGTRSIANKTATNTQTINTQFTPQTPTSTITTILPPNNQVKSSKQELPLNNISTTKICMSGTVVSIYDYCTKLCPDGETIVETLNCKAYTPTPTQQQIQVQQPAQNRNITLCNGINWSQCPSGQSFVCPTIGSAYCQSPQQQTKASSDSQALVRYQAQYQAVQDKIKPSQEQIDYLNKKSSACSGAEGGIQGAACLLAAQQAGDAAEYVGAILKDFLTPVTDTSIIYENKLDDLHNQIYWIKINYHQDVANITGVDMASYTGRSQNLLNTANAKIDAINQQILATQQEYQNTLTH